jgi:HPt (histidine-containing phosphotransfer) domain-containing protein
VVGKPVLIEALRTALASPAPGGGRTAEPPRNDALIDEAYLADQQLLLGAPRLRNLATLFAGTSAELTGTIDTAAAAGDRIAMRRAAHQLGSAASALALASLFARCTVIEKDAAALPVDGLKVAAEEIKALRERSLAALTDWLREPEAV